jgi:hypothetical protein
MVGRNLKWDVENDPRKGSGESSAPISDLQKRLSAQATSLTGSQKLVESIVIDARLCLT